MPLENGRLETIPFEVRSFRKLQHLSMYNNRLSSLPDYIGELDRLQQINLSNNKFDSLPNQLIDVKSLTILNLKGNSIQSLDGINQLSSNLLKLNLASNKIDESQIDLKPYSKLSDLDLSDNLMKAIPDALLQESLISLNLSNNEIVKIPESIGRLSKIRELNLSFNNITEIPESIGLLTNLRKLDLSGNQIVDLPKGISKLDKLTHLNLNGNPIGDVPPEIANQGLNGVLNYYINLGESVPLNEAKMLIVGQGGVGKTFLMNKLIFGQSPETVTTEGIDIQKWNMSIRKEESDSGNVERVRLNAWDFGGQEIYHSTHQFFLTKRSVYLFVWEARNDDSLLTFDYWLNIIRVLSNNSPVIVVLNKIDERLKEIDQKSIVEKFPNVIGFHSVSAKIGTNLEELTDRIQRTVIKLPHLGDKLPKVWSDIRAELEGLSDNYITYENYLSICNRHGLSKKDSKFLSQYFHDLGVFLHFVDNPILRPIVFLKPEWATNCVYQILDLKQVISNFGEFDSEVLDNLLSEYDSQQISYIIELMKKFELCFQLGEKKYVIPELLRVSEPKVKNFSNNGIGLVYQYDFMPAGIISRLIVRLKDNLVSGKYWKYGLFVRHQNTIGKVTSNQFSRSINIQVFGENEALLLGIIKRDLDHINESLNYPSHSIAIQCNCPNCSRAESPFMFNYEFLEKAKRAGVRTVHCQHHIVEVNLEQLIGPYQIKTANKGEDFGFNSTDLTVDIIEISTRILERKYRVEWEDHVNDLFTDHLRTKGYGVTDQTRSGRSNTQSGELDLMIRNLRGMPVAIVEALRLKSLGKGNQQLILHLNKMLVDYDTNGLSRNFLLVYSLADDFSDFWKKYQEYIADLHHHHLYNPLAKMTSYNINRDLSQRANLKVIVSQHEIGAGICDVYHIVLNMK